MEKEAIKQAIKELHQEGCFHVGCPWDGYTAQVEKLKLMEPMPEGAVKMVVMTWNILSGFGKRVGQAIAAGMFVFLIVLILAGVLGVVKVLMFFGVRINP